MLIDNWKKIKDAYKRLMLSINSIRTYNSQWRKEWTTKSLFKFMPRGRNNQQRRMVPVRISKSHEKRAAFLHDFTLSKTDHTIATINKQEESR